MMDGTVFLISTRDPYGSTEIEFTSRNQEEAETVFALFKKTRKDHDIRLFRRVVKTTLIGHEMSKSDKHEYLNGR